MQLNIGTCECTKDGFCNRYQREMGGRFREICASINVDLGTAAVFRDQWARETNARVPTSTRPPLPLLLITNQAAGDAVAMTAAIYSLHRTHPGRYITAVESNHPEVFYENPDVVPAESIPNALPLRMHYPAIHDSNRRGIHFMQGWCEFLASVLGVSVPLMTDRPRLYFKDPDPPTDNYWIICSGGKTDFTAKLWGHERYQSVVDALVLRGIRLVQIGENSRDHPPLKGVRNMVGETTLRHLFELIRRSRGVVCGISLPMHVAAALGKPAIVVAGGREPVAWNAYPKQHYLHTIGMMDCVTALGEPGGACWRSRTVPLGDGTGIDQHTCQYPTHDARPSCMNLIAPCQVVHLVLSYNQQYGDQL